VQLYKKDPFFLPCTLQRFGTESAFKRTVLDMIANDLLQRHFFSMQQQKQQQQQQQQQHMGGHPSSAALSGLNSREGSVKQRSSGLW